MNGTLIYNNIFGIYCFDISVKCLGKYVSKERAKEILQNIVTIKEFKSIGDKITLSQYKLEFSNDITNVYYMPKK